MSPSVSDLAELRHETTPVLVDRARVGFMLIIGAVFAFAIADVAVNQHVLGPLLGIAGAQAGAAVLGLVMLERRASWTLANGLAIAVVSFVFVTGAVSDVLSHNLYATSIMAPLGCLITAAFLPWGAGAQAATAVLVTSASLIGQTVMAGSFVAVGHLAVGYATAVGASVLIAHAFERGRLERFQAERALAASTAKAKDEAHVASVLVRVSEALGARLGQSDMLEAVSTIAREAIACDWTSTFLWDEARQAGRLAANVGSPAGIVADMTAINWTAAEAPVVGSIRPSSLLEIPDIRAQSLASPEFFQRFGVASILYAPIAAGGKLLGTHVYGYSTRTGPFTARQRRLALGVAHATAIAIENARLIDDLKAASRLKTEFVATMSHELRTPLNVITGYTDMMLEGAAGELPDTSREMLTRVQRSAVELFDLVTATLDVGRLESGREAIDLSATSLDAMFAELARELEPLVNPNVTLAWQNTAAGHLMTDRAKLKTIAKNLIGNALKFTHQGRVDVRATWAHDLLRLEIADTGIGIPADALPIVFEMFRQVDGSDSRRFGGVGLGLHIVKRLTTLLGGAVDVTSTVGRGSTFVVQIPATLMLRATGT